jgi:tRNA G10  N-methylase Trm11
MPLSGYRCVPVESLERNWKGRARQWGHSLHRICSRTGSFPAPLAHYFVTLYSDAGDTILDPFSGRGTVPLEACATGRYGVGNDIAPEAFVLTHAKVRPASLQEVQDSLADLRSRMDLSSFDLRKVDANIRIFFHPDTLKQILWIREALADDLSGNALFVKALMCGILHGSSDISLSVPCSHAFSMTPSYVERYSIRYGLNRPRKDVVSCLEAKAKHTLADPLPRRRGRATMTDARKLVLKDESVNMIFTSPPYWEKQTYARDNWLRLWFLGYDHKEVRKLQMRTISRTRFLQFMKECLQEMYRVLKENSACFVVIGDVTHNDHSTRTAILLGEVAESVGFRVARIISDRVPRDHKYFMFVPTSQGVRKDRIVELHKGRVHERSHELAWDDPYSDYLRSV